MLTDIRVEAAYTRKYTGKAELDACVLEAMERVPRHEFVPPEQQCQSYANHPLPIGYGQTISQPFIVALMTDLLRPQPDHIVLEIGTGSGYQSAVLSRLVKQVFSLEVIPDLARAAQQRLSHLGFHNIEVQVGDGYAGLPEHAPYHGIIVTAAAREVPPPLPAQLAPGARLIIPIGTPHQGQDLLIIERNLDGGISVQHVLQVAFVPFIRSSDTSAMPK